MLGEFMISLKDLLRSFLLDNLLHELNLLVFFIFDVVVVVYFLSGTFFDPVREDQFGDAVVD
jgi:hypothetical protein